ncbi:MAG: Fe2+-dependent dioxygenase [Alphaproteobacteria bacterium]|nr:Fe2+-dependent dioxygenase [Alphaproteobacteria bacterium]
MILIIDNLLDTKDLALVDRTLADARFRHGAISAGNAAVRRKHNLEMDSAASPGAQTVETLLVQALAANRTFSDHVLPCNFSRPIVSRYEVGMEYGRHVDNPLLGKMGAMLRTDVSVTVFLSDPADYDGGELMIGPEDAERAIKLPRGHAVAYVTGTPHRVAPVTRGARIAGILWAQSVVADPHKRQILSDLHRAHHMLADKAPAAPETDLLHQGYYNLMRLWAQP